MTVKGAIIFCILMACSSGSFPMFRINVLSPYTRLKSKPFNQTSDVSQSPVETLLLCFLTPQNSLAYTLFMGHAVA
jgi:hypothetical protein